MMNQEELAPPTGAPTLTFTAHALHTNAPLLSPCESDGEYSVRKRSESGGPAGGASSS